MNIVEIVRSLNLPENSYIVVGSGLMHVNGLRHAGDIDLVVNRQAYYKLLGQGWSQDLHSTGDTFVFKGDVEASMCLPGPRHKYYLAELLEEHMVLVDGIPFVSLEFSLNWKKHMQREKDLYDIRLIEDHLATQKD